MIVCDGKYLRELERQMKAARRELPEGVADAIDAEIEAIEAQGDPWYGTRVILVAFNLRRKSGGYRRTEKGHSFQGNLRKLPIGTKGLLIADWFEACAVNKDTCAYRTWRDPDDAIKALAISHRLHRYERAHHRYPAHSGQFKIDQWRLKNGKVLK